MPRSTRASPHLAISLSRCFIYFDIATGRRHFRLAARQRTFKLRPMFAMIADGPLLSLIFYDTNLPRRHDTRRFRPMTEIVTPAYILYFMPHNLFVEAVFECLLYISVLLPASFVMKKFHKSLDLMPDTDGDCRDEGSQSIMKRSPELIFDEKVVTMSHSFRFRLYTA